MGKFPGGSFRGAISRGGAVFFFFFFFFFFLAGGGGGVEVGGGQFSQNCLSVIQQFSSEMAVLKFRDRSGKELRSPNV